MRFLPQGAPVVVCAAFLVTAATAYAQPFNHEQCYKIKDPIKLDGIMDMDAPQYNVEPGCKVGKAKFFCAPAEKTFVSAIDKATGLPIAPLPVYGGPDGTFDRICYKMKCPEPVVPPDTFVTDQFGTRTLTKYKTKMLCTPAVKGAAYCGNGVLDFGEDCDPPAFGVCPTTCEPDCTCTCAPSCFISEQPPPSPPETECIEYLGTPAQTGVFAANWFATTSAPGISPAIHSAILGPCGLLVGPTFGVPCAGPPAHMVFIPADSSCP